MYPDFAVIPAITTFLTFQAHFGCSIFFSSSLLFLCICATILVYNPPPLPSRCAAWTDKKHFQDRTKSGFDWSPQRVGSRSFFVWKPTHPWWIYDVPQVKACCSVWLWSLLSALTPPLHSAFATITCWLSVFFVVVLAQLISLLCWSQLLGLGAAKLENHCLNYAGLFVSKTHPCDRCGLDMIPPIGTSPSVCLIILFLILVWNASAIVVLHVCLCLTACMGMS